MERKKESELFNLMADYYDTYRPGYPGEIVSAIIRKANLVGGSRLLEVGSGSGKATAQFAGNGFEMTCIDPGVDLVSLGNARFKGENVRFIASRFEDYAAPPAYYDAIFSAQAFHWVPQPIGYIKCAALLKKQGCLALFWNIDLFGDTETDRALWAILNKYDGFVACMSERDYAKRTEAIAAGIAQSGVFSQPEILRVIWEKEYSAEAYFGYLLTSQVFFQKPDEIKQACRAKLAQLSARSDGVIRRHYTCELYMAQNISKITVAV